MEIGTVVKIRNDLFDGQKDGQFTFRSSMYKYRGKYAKIIKIKPPLKNEYMDEISLDIDNGRHYWDITMFSEIK